MQGEKGRQKDGRRRRISDRKRLREQPQQDSCQGRCRRVEEGPSTRLGLPKPRNEAGHLHMQRQTISRKSKADYSSWYREKEYSCEAGISRHGFDRNTNAVFRRKIKYLGNNPGDTHNFGTVQGFCTPIACTPIACTPIAEYPELEFYSWFKVMPFDNWLILEPGL